MSSLDKIKKHKKSPLKLIRVNLRVREKVYLNKYIKKTQTKIIPNKKSQIFIYSKLILVLL